MRTLGIDLGTRRIGLALSDEGGRFVNPYDILHVRSPEQGIEPIVKIVEKEGIQRIVVGLPLNMDGTLGPAAKTTITWSRALSEKAGLAPVFVDERLSSFAAEQELQARRQAGEKLTRKRKKDQLDALAAAGFLQAFLDGKIAPLQINPEAD